MGYEHDSVAHVRGYKTEAQLGDLALVNSELRHFQELAEKIKQLPEILGWNNEATCSLVGCLDACGLVKMTPTNHHGSGKNVNPDAWHVPSTKPWLWIDMDSSLTWRPCFFLIQQWKAFSLVGLYVCLRVLMFILYTLNRIVHPIWLFCFLNTKLAIAISNDDFKSDLSFTPFAVWCPSRFSHQDGNWTTAVGLVPIGSKFLQHRYFPEKSKDWFSNFGSNPHPGCQWQKKRRFMIGIPGSPTKKQ